MKNRESLLLQILTVVIGVGVLIIFSKPVAQPQPAPMPRDAYILQLEGARDYYRNEAKLLRIKECESRFRHEGVWGDGGKSYGEWQFQESTFEDFKKYSGHDEWQWQNRDHQEAAARWAFDNGYAGRWTCYGIVCGQYPDLCEGE